MSELEGQSKEPLSLDIIYDLVLKRLDTQMQQIDAIDTKLSITFGFASLAIGTATGFASLRESTICLVSLILLAASLLAYVFVLGFALKAYIFANFSWPDVGRIHQQLLFRQPTTTKRQILANIVDAIQYNENLISRKACYGKWAFGLLFIEVICLTIALYFFLL